MGEGREKTYEQIGGNLDTSSFSVTFLVPSCACQQTFWLDVVSAKAFLFLRHTLYFYSYLKIINIKLFFISNSCPSASCHLWFTASWVEQGKQIPSIVSTPASPLPKHTHFTWACRTVSCSFSTLAWSFHSAAWFSNCGERECVEGLSFCLLNYHLAVICINSV